MDFKKLETILKNEPAFRLKQVKKLVLKDLIDDWQKATILPKSLRENLNKNFPINISDSFSATKKGEAVKTLLILKDGLKVESVLIKHKGGRNTVCVSSQAGCPLACTFCATGKMGFKRNLTFSEILIQLLFFSKHLKENRERISNVVFMGMGEPFLNYDNVLEAIKSMNDKEGLNIGARHISISTVGIAEGIEKLSREKMEINLAISLHAPNNDLRKKIMPINDKYPIEKILKSVDDYIGKKRRRVMFEYIMIKDFNDNKKNAEELANLMRKKLYFVNLISYNPTGNFKPSPGIRIKMFKEVLKNKGVKVTQRYRFGENIDAACGQLAQKQN